MKRFYFDLETAPLSAENLAGIMPEFEPAANLKDPDKIAASIAAKKQAWIDDCALRATTGRIIAASACFDDRDPEFYYSPDEQTMVGLLVHDISQAIGLGGRIYAWNMFGFDLPFLMQRCAVHGIGKPFATFTTCFRGRWSWNEAFTDPMQIWTGPYQRSDGASLKAVAFALGCGTKSGSGKDFVKLLESDPAAAKEYSLTDVKLLRSIVEKMGI